MKRFTILLLLLALTAGIAIANPTPEAEEIQADKTIDFEGDLVEVDWLRPDQGMTEAVVREKKPSLINVRTHFTDEIIRSANNL